jgi:hypothetical protein
MFDEHARRVIDELPRLPELDPVQCRRALSRAYVAIVNQRVESELPEGSVELSQLLSDLRRMVNALESVAVFDPLNGIQLAESARSASAFVAAEALALSAVLLANAPVLAEDEESSEAADDPIQDGRAYAHIESGLLYMIGGYDINAVAVVADLQVPRAPEHGDAYWVSRCRAGGALMTALLHLCRGEIPGSVTRATLPERQLPNLEALANATRRALYAELTFATDGYLQWLGGSGDVDSALERIERVRKACMPAMPTDGTLPADAGFSDVYHLASLLAAAIGTTRMRSVVHAVPPPGDGDPTIRAQFGEYLERRAKGSTTLRGRPLLWPSTLEYVHQCLPGPEKDAVVSMPTGSGKSFLAELAVAHALTRGWVLYLAPTNALAHQIRRDLLRALRPFDGVTVSAFVGGAEYTALSDEEIGSGPLVAVMTPEKCALALRLYPDHFSRCSLCVFDECHLLNDSGRGGLADILLAQLFQAAPTMRMLLMSAMVANADELADWLTAVRPNGAVPSKVKWRPSRAARGFVFVDQERLESQRKVLRETLKSKKGAGTCRDVVPIGWVMGLSGPWSSVDGADDYAAARLPIGAVHHVKRSKRRLVTEDYDGWKNPIGARLAGHLARKGMPTIDFILSSRHHAFGQAADVVDALPDAVGDGAIPELIEAQLSIADAELGVPTEMRSLLRKGVSVHTAAMLQVEQAASEYMFASGKAKLMFATGTLAQGLNLPAAAVVVSGSQVGGGAHGQGMREVDAAAGLTRANELILNGFGRAGRPGFSNQGVVVLVSDHPFSAPIVAHLDGRKAVGEYPVLGEPDASIVIKSPIESFLDELFTSAADDASRLEVSLVAHLSTFDGQDENAGTILRRTFAGYRKRSEFTDEYAALANARVAELKSRFLEQEGVPPWMPKAAMKAGVEFFRAQRMWQAYVRRGLPDVSQFAAWSIREWFDVFIEVLSLMPVTRVFRYLDQLQTPTPRTRLNSLATPIKPGERDNSAWIVPAGWDSTWKELAAVAFAYMSGASYTAVGAQLYGIDPSSYTSKRSDGARGIPPVFKFVGEIVERNLATDAGCFLALHEGWLEAAHPGVPCPETLQALPLCVRNGCSTLDELAWFRFGFRQRVCAHALAKAFPIPSVVSNDEGRAEYVRDARHMWLNNQAPDTDPLLGFARTVITEGSSERN